MCAHAKLNNCPHTCRIEKQAGDTSMQLRSDLLALGTNPLDNILLCPVHLGTRKHIQIHFRWHCYFGFSSTIQLWCHISLFYCQYKIAVSHCKCWNKRSYVCTLVANGSFEIQPQIQKRQKKSLHGNSSLFGLWIIIIIITWLIKLQIIIGSCCKCLSAGLALLYQAASLTMIQSLCLSCTNHNTIWLANGQRVCWMTAWKHVHVNTTTWQPDPPMVCIFPITGRLYSWQNGLIM